MSPLPSDPYIELLVPEAKTEQEFLRLAVQAAVMKYRGSHHNDSSPPQHNRSPIKRWITGRIFSQHAEEPHDCRRLPEGPPHPYASC